MAEKRLCFRQACKRHVIANLGECAPDFFDFRIIMRSFHGTRQPFEDLNNNAALRLHHCGGPIGHQAKLPQIRHVRFDQTNQRLLATGFRAIHSDDHFTQMQDLS